MAWIATAIVASSVVNGIVSSNAASDAANTQAQAGQRSLDLQRYIYNNNVALQSPYNQFGQAGMARLSYLLGINPYNFPVNGGNYYNSGSYGFSPYSYSGNTANTSGNASTGSQPNPAYGMSVNLDRQDPATDPATATGGNPGGAQGQGQGQQLDPITAAYQQYLGRNPDPAGLAYWQKQVSSGAMTADQATQAIANSGEGQQVAQAANTEGGFGSLMKPFSLSDFQEDPGIQFQTQQGNLALQNSQAAKDGVLSGAALKDLIGYNQGMAGLGYQSAFDRYMANRQSTYNMLMGVTGVGQSAATNASANAAAYGQNAGNTIVGIGNAQAAGQVGSANAITGATSNGLNGYLLSQYMSPGGGGASNFSTSPMSGLIYSNGSLGD